MDSADDRVRQAMAVARTGQKEEARAELVALVKANEDSAAAWAALAQLADTPKDAAYCLRQVLRIQPANEWALYQLKRLSQQQEEVEQPAALSQTSQSARMPGKLVIAAVGAMALLCLVGGLAAIQAGALPGMFARPAGVPAPHTGAPSSKSPASSAVPQTATEPITVSPVESGSTATPRTTRRGSPTVSRSTQTTAVTTPTSTTTSVSTQTQWQTPTAYPTATDPPDPTGVPTSEPSPAAAPCDCYGESLTCRDFDTQTQAQACYLYCLDETGMDIFYLDSDQDDIACND